jgi:hypothetical protein
MMDEFRSHDPRPTAEERAWMATDPFKALIRVAALATLAVAIGLTGTQALNPPAQTKVASTAR